MIEIIMEGQLEKESDRESFAELLKEVSEKHKIKIEDYDTMLSMEVCPEGVIECSFEGKFISIAAQTNVAGPGFHACTALIFDDIMLESGMVFDVNDPTQYYENRDFEALKYKYFYPWLKTIAEYILEHAPNDDNICICWPIDEYQPRGRKGHVVTPMGYMAVEDFADKDIEALAEQFFIWNHAQRDAHFYRNCALTLLWKECFFEYSLMNETSNKTANLILDYLEAAFEADNLLDLPYDIYDQLCDSVCREKLIHGEHKTRVYEIGYRKELIYYTLSHWRIPCSGFAEKTFDRVTDTLNIMAPYKSADTPWQWLIKANEYAHAQGEQHYYPVIEQGENVFELNVNDMSAKGCVDMMDDYHVLRLQVNHDEDALYIECIIRQMEDVECIKAWCSQITYLKQDIDTMKN